MQTAGACARALATRLFALVATLGAGASLGADRPPGEFVRGINLNGPPVVIDGRTWEGGDSPNVVCRDSAFANRDVPLVPTTDPERSRMIRSSRWGSAVDLALINLPKGTYRVVLYVWEDNQAERFRVAVDGREVSGEVDSGPAGTWQKLGPWEVASDSGTIRVTTKGGAANLSGVELWRVGGPEADPVASRRFDAEVAPILARHCLECHSGSIRKAGLDLSSSSSARRGARAATRSNRASPGRACSGSRSNPTRCPRGRGGRSCRRRRRRRSDSGSPAGRPGARRRSTRSWPRPIGGRAMTGGRCSPWRGPRPPR